MPVWSDAIGTTQALFRFGLTGLGLRTNAGRLQVRNAADSANSDLGIRALYVDDAATSRSQLAAQQSLTAITAAQGFNAQGIQNYAIISEEVTATAYTIVAGDMGKQKVCSASTAISVTIPSGLPAGFNCMIVPSSTGQVTIVQGAGTTVLNARNQFKTAFKDSLVSILPGISANLYRIAGDTAA